MRRDDALNLPVWNDLEAMAADFRAHVKTLTAEQLVEAVENLQGATDEEYRRIEIEGILFDVAYHIIHLESGTHGHVVTIYTMENKLPDAEIADTIANAILGERRMRYAAPSIHPSIERACFIRIENQIKTRTP